MTRTDVDPTDLDPIDVNLTDEPNPRRTTVRAPRRRTRLAAITVVLAAALTGCGDDDASSSPGGADAAPGGESADVGADGNGGEETGDGAEPGQADPPAPTGEARATIEMRGEVHHLALDHDVVQMGQVRCDIDSESQLASVGGMVSAEGLQLHMLPAIGFWAAVVIEPDDVSWRAGAADTHPDTDYTFEVTEGRVVIDGIWGAGDGGERTEEIRVELICPPTEEGTNG